MELKCPHELHHIPCSWLLFDMDSFIHMKLNGIAIGEQLLGVLCVMFIDKMASTFKNQFR